MAEILHTNIYLNNHELNNHEADTIGNAIDRVEQFVAELEVVRSGPPRPFQVRTNSDRNRLQCVPGRRVGENESSDDGFVNRDYLDRLRRRREL